MLVRTRTCVIESESESEGLGALIRYGWYLTGLAGCQGRSLLCDLGLQDRGREGV